MSNQLYHKDKLTNKVITSHAHLLDYLQQIPLSERGTIRQKLDVIPLGKSCDGLHVDKEFLDIFIYPSLSRIGIPSELYKEGMRYCDKDTEISKKCLKQGLKKHNDYINPQSNAYTKDYKLRKRLEYNEIIDVYANIDDLWHYKKQWSEMAALHECITKIINGDIVDIGILLKHKMSKDAQSVNKTFDEYLKIWIASKSDL
eukprot:88712_1